MNWLMIPSHELYSDLKLTTRKHGQLQRGVNLQALYEKIPMSLKTITNVFLLKQNTQG